MDTEANSRVFNPVGLNVAMLAMLMMLVGLAGSAIARGDWILQCHLPTRSSPGGGALYTSLVGAVCGEAGLSPRPFLKMSDKLCDSHRELRIHRRQQCRGAGLPQKPFPQDSAPGSRPAGRSGQSPPMGPVGPAHTKRFRSRLERQD